MTRWSFDEAQGRFSEVLRLAVDGAPQRVTVNGRDSVVVLSAKEYDRIVGRTDLLAFLQASPLADAIAAGEWETHRDSDPDRRIDLG